MKRDFKADSTALGTVLAMIFMVTFKFLKLLWMLTVAIAKAIQAATPEVKAQIRANAGPRSDAIIENVRLRLISNTNVVEAPAKEMVG